MSSFLPFGNDSSSSLIVGHHGALRGKRTKPKGCVAIRPWIARARSGLSVAEVNCSRWQ